MIRHIVMFEFFEEAEGRSREENTQIASDMLIALQGVVPTLISSEVKRNAKTANPSNYDLVLIADFNSMEDLKSYIVHPEHKKVGEFMAKVRKSRACVDFEL